MGLFVGDVGGFCVTHFSVDALYLPEGTGVDLVPGTLKT